MGTISQIMALKDKFTPTLSKIHKACLQQSQSFKDLKHNTDNYKSSLNGLDSMLKKVIGTAALMKGVKDLIDLSDTYTQTSARLGMITDDVAGLENQIYKVAQSSRVSYQSVADTVSKLGMQAGDAFNNSTDEVLAFSDLLNKTFTFSGLDSTAIDSVMYNLTQSLASGRLLGQDYRILKQNAPQLIKYLEQFYGVSRAGLDEMVSKGQVTAEGLKKAMFSATDDINNRFKKMPVTFGQVWTKFKNTLFKILKPVLKVLSALADWLEKIVDFLDTHTYVLYAVAIAIGALAIEYIALNAAAVGAKIAQWALNSAMLACPVTWIILLIAALIVVLGYLWETNDKVAYYLIYAWDVVRIAMGIAVSGIKALWMGLVAVVGGICYLILKYVQELINKVIDAANVAIEVGNRLGGHAQKIERKTFADKFGKGYADYVTNLGQDLSDTWNDSVINKTIELNASRQERTDNRKKLGDLSQGVQDLLGGGIGDSLESVMGSDGSGGKAIKTTTNDDLLSDDDIQLLLDVATRDYKLNYQQVTPNITLTFGDIRETADVDTILDQVADRLEEIYEGNLEVNPT